MRPIHNKLTNSVAVFTLALMAVLVFNTCKENPVDPNANLTPGRRDYVWTVDTISTDPFVYITRFWGSAPNDIWAVDLDLFHYDGKQWKEFNPGISIGAQAIFGFAQNNVWAAGYNKFWHFNGTSWRLFSTHTIDGYNNVTFADIWGNAPNNVYAIGYGASNDGAYKGIIMHYNGSMWDFIRIPIMEMSFIDIKKANNKLLVLGIIFLDSGGQIFKLFEINGTTFKELYSGNDYPKLTYLDDNLFIKIERKIFKYFQGRLELFIDFSQTEYVGGFWGRTEKDFFCVTQNGLGHYNGTDLVTIYHFDIRKLNLANGLLFDKEVFVRGRDEQANMSIVIKGKLEN